jgi:hypothetical protein
MRNLRGKEEGRAGLRSHLESPQQGSNHSLRTVQEGQATVFVRGSGLGDRILAVDCQESGGDRSASSGRSSEEEVPAGGGLRGAVDLRGVC